MGSIKEGDNAVIPTVEAAARILNTRHRGPKLFGLEIERPLVVAATGDLPDYADIRNLIQLMQTRFNWDVVYEGENPISLQKTRPGGDPRNPAHTIQITFEPGGALEIATSAHARLGDLHRELAEVDRQARICCDELDLVPLGVGFFPMAHVEDRLVMSGKSRYQQLWRFLDAAGKEAAIRTGGLQVTLDYTDEANFVSSMRVMTGLMPVVTALLGNSPYKNGIPSGHESVRMIGWNAYGQSLSTGQNRIFADGYGYEGHMQNLLAMPHKFNVIGGIYTPADGRPLSAHLAEGAVTETMLRNHVTTQPPYAARGKPGMIEACGADSVQDVDMMMAGAALWVGLLYDPKALQQSLELVSSFDNALRQRLYTEAPTTGLATVVDGSRLLQHVARDMIQIARGGLRRRRENPDMLAPLDAILQNGTLASQALNALARLKDSEGIVPAGAFMKYYGPAPISVQHTGYARVRSERPQPAANMAQPA